MCARRIVAVGMASTLLSLGLTYSGTFTRSALLAMPVAALQGNPLPGLTCIQNALGGARAIAAVSSLRIISDTKPAASSGARPLPGTRETNIVLPDRYKRIDVGRFRDGGTLPSTAGFDRGDLLSSPRGPVEHSLRLARQEFVGDMLIRLPRPLAGVSLSQRVVQDGGQERLAIDASGPDDLRTTLLADRGTCLPVAVHYEFPPGRLVRIDVSGHREFSGLRFPTTLERSHNGVPFVIESVTTMEVNAPGAVQAFAPPR